MDNANLPVSDNHNIAATRQQWWHHPHRTHRFWITIFFIIVIVGLIRQHDLHNESKRQKGKLLPVVVLAVATSKNIPIYISALGSVIPTYSVTVKTQINGQLIHVFFKEGQIVKTGDLIAQIDDRPYLAQLTQYQGQLVHDRALLANALIDLKRYQTLWKQDSISQQTLATQEALVKQYQGSVEIDEGLIQGTRLNLIYCRITSPIDGRVGLRLVDPGNFVQTSDTTGLAIINMLDPITVVFTIPEDDVPKVMSKLNANQPLQVQAYDRQQVKLLATGTLLTIDNQIDPTTGTVKLKAKFENKNNALFANQFVNVQLLLSTLNQATVVPTAAIQPSTQGNFVYVYNNNDTVSVKHVKVGVTSGEDTVIASGLMKGESVVIEGADKLINGAKVTVAHAKAPSAAVKVAMNTHHGRLFS